MAAAGDQIEVFPAFRIDARFLTCYGKVPDGYIGVIILPPPAATVNAAAGVVLQEFPELLDTFLDLDIHPDSSAATIKSDVLATLDPVSPDRRKGSSLSPPGCLKSSSVPPPLLHPNPGPGNDSSRNPVPPPLLHPNPGPGNDSSRNPVPPLLLHPGPDNDSSRNPVPPPLLHPNPGPGNDSSRNPVSPPLLHPGPGNDSSRNPDPHNLNLDLHHGHPDNNPNVLEVWAPQTPIDVSSNSDLGNDNESSGNTEGSKMKSDKGSKWSKPEDAILQQHALQYTGLGALEGKIDWTPLLAILPGRTWKAMEGRWYGTLRKNLAAAGVLVDRKAAKSAATAMKNKRVRDSLPAAKRAQELARYHAPGSHSLKKPSKKVQGSARASRVIFKIKNEVVGVLDNTEENDVGDLPPKKDAAKDTDCGTKESPEE